MKRIDQLIQMMAQRRVERVLIVAGQPLQIFAQGRQAAGNTLTQEQLESLLGEVMPPDAVAHLGATLRCRFAYECAHGFFDINVQKPQSVLQAAIVSRGERVGTTPPIKGTSISGTSLITSAPTATGQSPTGNSPVSVQIPAPTLITTLNAKHKVQALAFAPSGDSLAVGMANGQILVWNLQSGEIRRTLAHGGLTDLGGVSSLSFSPDGKTLVSGGLTKVTAWNLLTAAPRWSKKSLNHFYSVACSPSGKIVAAGEWYGEVNFYDLNTGNLVQSTDKRKIKGVSAMANAPQMHLVAFSGDGALLCGVRGREVKVWNAESATLATNLSHPGSNEKLGLAMGLLAGPALKAVAGAMRGADSEGDLLAVYSSVAISIDGKSVAAGGHSSGSQNKANLWDVPSGKRYSLSEHSRNVTALAFSPAGRVLTTATNNDVKLWDTATREMQRTVREHTAKVGAVVISPDGKSLASGSHDNTVRLYRLG